MVTQDTIRRRVNRGIKLLNLRQVGWAKRIDLNTLDINYPTKCVLGQLFGNDIYGLDLLQLNREQEVTHGFNSKIGQYDYDMPRLTKTWKRVIRKLQTTT